MAEKITVTALQGVKHPKIVVPPLFWVLAVHTDFGSEALRVSKRMHGSGWWRGIGRDWRKLDLHKCQIESSDLRVATRN